jgi:hypothetical protein
LAAQQLLQLICVEQKRDPGMLLRAAHNMRCQQFMQSKLNCRGVQSQQLSNTAALSWCPHRRLKAHQSLHLICAEKSGDPGMLLRAAQNTRSQQQLPAVHAVKAALKHWVCSRSRNCSSRCNSVKMQIPAGADTIATITALLHHRSKTAYAVETAGRRCLQYAFKHDIVDSAMQSATQ